MKKQVKGYAVLPTFRTYLVFCCLLLAFAFCVEATAFPLASCCAHPASLATITQKQINTMAKQTEEPTAFIFHCQGPTYTINEEQLQEYFPASKQPKFVAHGGRAQKVQMLQRIVAQGYTKAQSVMYMYPSLVLYVAWLREKVNVPAQNAQLLYHKSTKKMIVQPEKQGRFIHVEKLYTQIFEQLQTKNMVELEVPMQTEEPKITQAQAKVYAQPMASFSTKFATSNTARSNNIAQAMQAFDGYILPPQAEVSFNQTTGVRNKENGYMPAKIIQNGTYVEGYGGGVCQASTTLYNAALLAGLTITEVHPHSLQVGYVQAGFDAMVNIGSSDLKIKNPFPYPVCISTQVVNGTCQVTIYGKPSGYTYTRETKIIKTLPQAKPKKQQAAAFQGQPLYQGEQVWLTYGKAGVRTKSLLHTYQNGKKVQSQTIRENTYASTQGVVLEGTTPCIFL